MKLQKDKNNTIRKCSMNHAEDETTCQDLEASICEFCSKDGCNGAGHYGPITLLVAIPVIIAKMFTFSA